MPFVPSDKPASFVLWERHRPEGHTLVELHVVADLGGLPDDHTGGVVDEEVPAYSSPGVQVDAGGGMSPFGHDAGYERHVHEIELVREPVDGDGQHARVGEDDLPGGFRRTNVLTGMARPLYDLARGIVQIDGVKVLFDARA